MRVPEVLFFYVIIGLAVAVYAHRQTGEVGVAATLLWPLWLPALLAPQTARYDTAPSLPTPSTDALARLEQLLREWDADMAPHVGSLRTGLGEIHTRQSELRAELDRPENDLDRLRKHAREESTVGEVYRRRLENVVAMTRLHDQLKLELRTALAQLEELSSRVQLARFSGATVEGVGAQLRQLVAAVDGVREIEQL